MVDKISNLIIPRSTVESIGQQEIGQLMVGFTWRKSVWQKPHKLIQIGLMQIIGATMIFTAMMLPIDRGLNAYHPPQSQSDRVVRLVWIDGTITLLMLVGINQWIYDRGKRLQKLLKLVEQIEDYNRIINSIDTLKKVAEIAQHQGETAQSKQMMEILGKTRQNLLVALEIDRYLRQYPNSSELTLAIANNLIDLQNLAQQPQLAEYGMLLTQAWEIGMSVYEEKAG